MGVYYTCYVLPTIGAAAFMPSAEQLSSVIGVLLQQQWAAPSERYRVVVGTPAGELSSTHVRDASRMQDLDGLLASGRAFTVSLPQVPEGAFWPDDSKRPDGRSRKYDFEESDGLLLPSYCDGVTLLCSPAPFCVPVDGYSGTPVPCPHCDSDTLSDLDLETPLWRGVHDSDVTQTIGATCPSCNATLNVAELVAEMRCGITGVPVSEAAALGRIMLSLELAPKAGPPAYPHGIDARLTDALRESTGVEFRHVGRWS